MSSAAVVIGALRVNDYYVLVEGVIDKRIDIACREP